jgi:hypothetical protein
MELPLLKLMPTEPMVETIGVLEELGSVEMVVEFVPH